MRGSKPGSERSEIDSCCTTSALLSEEVVAADQWRKTLLRDDSIVNDLMGGLVRCQLVCRRCQRTTVFFEHQNTVALSLRSEIFNCRSIVVLIVQEAPTVKGTMKAALPPPIMLKLKLGGDRCVGDLRRAVLQHVEGLAIDVRRSLLLVESNRGDPMNLRRSLRDDLGVDQIKRGSAVVAYLLPIGADNFFFLLQRGVEEGEGEGGNLQLPGRNLQFPMAVSVEATWGCRRVRYQVALQQEGRDAEGSVHDLIDEAAEMAIRFTTSSGEGLPLQGEGATRGGGDWLDAEGTGDADSRFGPKLPADNKTSFGTVLVIINISSCCTVFVIINISIYYTVCYGY